MRHAANMMEMRNAYKVLVPKPEQERVLGISMHRWEDNINMNLRETVDHKKASELFYIFKS
jgi:hypothetical protein